MINVASRATKGVDIPSRKTNRKTIIEKFKEQMRKLRDLFKVRNFLPLLLCRSTHFFTEYERAGSDQCYMRRLAIVKHRGILHGVRMRNKTDMKLDIYTSLDFYRAEEIDY